MKFTIDTFTKTITLHGSFTYDDFVNFRQILPKEWSEDFVFLIDIRMVGAFLEQKQIAQTPYPLIGPTGAPLEYNRDCYQPEPCGEACVCHEN